MVKSVGVELLRDQVEHGLVEHILHICTHFSNLIKEMCIRDSQKAQIKIKIRHCSSSWFGIFR